MGDIVYPPSVPNNTPPNFSGPSLTHTDEWWDGWLSGTQVLPDGYKIVRTDKEPCPQASGPDAPPAGEKVTETRQNTVKTILTYIVSRYKLETSIWWYIGAGAVVLGVAVVVVATAGWGAGLIAAATLGKVAAGAAIAVTLGSGVVGIVGSSKRGSYISGTTTTETVGPTDSGSPYTVISKPCK